MTIFSFQKKAPLQVGALKMNGLAVREKVCWEDSIQASGEHNRGVWVGNLLLL